MAYTIQKSDGSTLVILSGNTVDTTSTSITLFGRGRLEWGEPENNNLVHMLENFADGTPPLNPQVGQLWYNTTAAVGSPPSGEMTVFVGGQNILSNWKGLLTSLTATADFVNESGDNMFGDGAAGAIGKTEGVLSFSATDGGFPYLSIGEGQGATADAPDIRATGGLSVAADIDIEMLIDGNTTGDGAFRVGTGSYIASVSTTLFEIETNTDTTSILTRFNNFNGLNPILGFDNQLIAFDGLPEKRITCNDGGGNLVIKCGTYFSGNNLYGTTGDGATLITQNFENVNGLIRLETSPIGVANAALTFDTSLQMTLGNIVLTADDDINLTPTGRVNITTGDFAAIDILGVDNGLRGLYIQSQLAITGGTTDGFLRLNQGIGFTNGVFTPGDFRCDGEIRVDVTRGIRNVTGGFGTIQTNLAGGVSGWEGYNIDGRAVFMHDGLNSTRIYNDVDNDDMIICTHNGAVSLYFDSIQKMGTTLTGGFVTGVLQQSANGTASNHTLRKDQIDALSPQPGTVVPYAGTTGAPAGWVHCAGGVLNRVTFADLFAVIGLTYGFTAGTNFRVPDYRGEFIRGYSAGVVGRDPDKASRLKTRPFEAGGLTGDNIGTRQAHALLAHDHPLQWQFRSIDGSSFDGDGSVNPGAAGPDVINNNTLQTSTETRPRNVYVQFIIKT